MKKKVKQRKLPRTRRVAKKAVRLQTAPLTGVGTPFGNHINLREIFGYLSSLYFRRRRVRAKIVWGGTQRFSWARGELVLGLYDFSSRQITISPLLDREGVPWFVVAAYVFHEMLHQVHPPKAIRRGGRKLLHTPGFLVAESLFPDMRRAEAWVEEHKHWLASGELDGPDEGVASVVP